MPVGEAEAGIPWLGDERRRPERLPRLHLLDPSVRILAGQPDAALQRNSGRIAARLPSVLVHATEEDPALRVTREVRTPAVVQSRQASEGGLGWHRLLTAAHAEPDRNGLLDWHRVEPGVGDPMELAAKIHHRLRPQRTQHRDLFSAAAAAVLEGFV